MLHISYNVCGGGGDIPVEICQWVEILDYRLYCG